LPARLSDHIENLTIFPSSDLSPFHARRARSATQQQRPARRSSDETKEDSVTRPRRTALSTGTLEEAQRVTSRIWSRHRSTVPDPAAFRSDIARFPLGRSHFALVDCRSAISVDVDGCADRVFAYLPIEGSVEFSAAQERLSAGPGEVALLAPGIPYRFEATPVRCMVMEVRADRILEELKIKGFPGTTIVSRAWPQPAPEATGLSSLGRFLLSELQDDSRPPLSARYLRRMEALLLTALARAIAGSLPKSPDTMIGRRSLEEVDAWLEERIPLPCTAADLAAFTGLSLRSMQRGFLRHFHSTPTAYLQALRLDAARAALLAGRGRVSITEVAPDFQFHHLGRFASAYRTRFGESPSETLAAFRRPKP
jgi:AraC-like DNA-binding protein